jgi:[protein-PII] uridylyltransferase
MEFRDTKRYYASEIMMRVFYMRSKAVADTLKKFVGLCGTRYFKLPKSFTVKKINDEFFISKNEIIVKDSNVFQDTSKIIEAFRIFSATGKPFSLQVEELLKNCAFSIGREGRASRSAILHFREILRGNRTYETLRKMHDTCVLDRFIPEFGRIRHLIILESFHRYTVDEHTLMAIRNLENLKKTSDGRLRYLADILKTVNQEVLYAAILFHDIGKGVSRKHEEAGYIIIRGILERLLFDQAERQIIEFLVRNHIVLAIFALSRDIYAPETIVRLAEIADNEENLNALYLMTYADMSAVNPSFWNEWKASLLRNLYNRTLQHLRGIIHDPYASLEDIVGSFAKKMPERYLLSNTPEEIKKDHDLAVIAAREKIALSITEKNAAATEIIVVTGNVPGLIPAIIGILSKRGLNIISARLFTGECDLVICKITLSNWRELFWDGMEAGIVDDLRKTLLLPGVETQILSFTASNKSLIRRSGFLLDIDNETNDSHTILEVMLPDKIGLLYDIAIRLRDNKIDILSAMINTDDGMAHDVFYVQKNDSRLGYQECMNILCDLLSIEAAS